MQIGFVILFPVQLSDCSHMWQTVRVCSRSQQVLPQGVWLVNKDRRCHKHAPVTPCALAPAAVQCLLLLTPPHCPADAAVAGRCITTSSSPAAIRATTVPAAASNHRYLHQHQQLQQQAQQGGVWKQSTRVSAAEVKTAAQTLGWSSNAGCCIAPSAHFIPHQGTSDACRGLKPAAS